MKLAPADTEARAELQSCKERLAEYRARKRELSKRMLAGADGGVVEEAAASGEETGAPRPALPSCNTSCIAMLQPI